MSKPKIVCVTPSIRPERMETFRRSWADLFEKHEVTLVTVWDGEEPQLEIRYPGGDVANVNPQHNTPLPSWLCRFTDAVRNLGFLVAARLNPDYVLTLDDDVEPPTETDGVPKDYDPVAMHLAVLDTRVPMSWVTTFIGRNEKTLRLAYPRGFPYGIYEESPVMLSHGIWSNVLDWDGETQVAMEEAGQSLGFGYYTVGPVPRGVLFPLCGMNVMVRREALPYFYFAPMGPDSGVEGLHRFGDIWMGVYLKREFDRLGWACYTGGSVVRHTRASDARKNFEQEKLGREWNEVIWQADWHDGENDFEDDFIRYCRSYAKKRQQFFDDVTNALGGK